MNQELGLAVDHRYWKKPNDLVATLNKVVTRLAAEGIAPSDIVILSPRRLDGSSLSGVSRIGELPLRDASADQPVAQGSVAFSTIHAFKGLESAAVIVTDIEQVDTDEARSLLYVGMSRARSLLILMIRETARHFLEQRIRETMNYGLQS
jgi:hypothetical protein